jgi:hypothetical protein
MSTTWLHVQSFFTDGSIMKAINDLSIALKLQSASKDDPDWKDLGERGRRTLETFLHRVINLGESATGGVILGVDPRTQSLVHSLEHTQDAVCGASPRVGLTHSPRNLLDLLRKDDPASRAELLSALRELYQVILAHQQQDEDILFQGQ